MDIGVTGMTGETGMTGATGMWATGMTEPTGPTAPTYPSITGYFNLTVPFALTISKTVNIVKFKITSAVVTPFVQGTLFIVLEDSSGEEFPRLLVITGTDYMNWNTDDYLFNYVNSNISSIFHSTT